MKVLARIIMTAAAVFVLTTPAYAAYIDLVSDLQPTSTWRLGETSGAVAVDAVQGIDGAYHNTSLGAGGAIVGDLDTGIGFRANGYVDIPHDDSFLMDSGTVMLWFKDTGTIRTAGLFSKDSMNYDTGGHLTMMTTTSGVEVRLQSTNSSRFVRTDPFGLDEWHHVAFTFGSEGMKLYMDGALVDSESYYGGLGATSGGVGNFEPIVLGASARHSGDRRASPLRDFYSGCLDEVAIFDHALSGEQIAQVHRVGVGSETHVPEPGAAAMIFCGASLIACRRRRRTANRLALTSS